MRPGEISANSDVDYYAVNVSGLSIVHVNADGDPERDGVGTDVAVDFIDTDRTTVLFSANSSADGLGTDDPPAEGFPFLVKSAGTYYVRVKGAMGATGTYDVMTAVCPTKPTLLTATPTPGALQLTWPVNVEDCQLQSSSDLMHWQDMDAKVEISGEHFTVEVPADSDAMFFRLITE